MAGACQAGKLALRLVCQRQTKSLRDHAVRSTRLDESIFTGKEVSLLANPVPSGLNMTLYIRQITLRRYV
jgi:hypothetical protein